MSYLRNGRETMHCDEPFVGAELPEKSERVDLPRAVGCAPVEQLLEWRFPKEAGGVTLVGRSRAAQGTGFAVPSLGWVLDAGVLAHAARPEHIFISHTHTDHVHHLVHLKSRRKPPVIYVPAHAVPLVENYLTVAQELTSNCVRDPDVPWTPSYRLQGVVPGDSFVIEKGRDKFLVEVVACDHSVPCVGYRFSALREKLKPTYRGLPGVEMAALRKQGVTLTEEQVIPMFAYLGDTTPAVFSGAPSLLSTPLVMVECSFLEASHQEHALRTRHSSWEELSPVIRDNPDVTFVLMHFSLRYKDDDIRDFFRGKLPQNVVCWLDGMVW
jgi:ribonuclease Z